MYQVEVFKQNLNNYLVCEKWRFLFFDNPRNPILKLMAYFYLTKPTRRHKFKVEKFYNAYNQRGSMPVEDVPLPDEIREEARQILFRELTVEK